MLWLRFLAELDEGFEELRGHFRILTEVAEAAEWRASLKSQERYSYLLSRIV